MYNVMIKKENGDKVFYTNFVTRKSAEEFAAKINETKIRGTAIVEQGKKRR